MLLINEAILIAMDMKGVNQKQLASKIDMSPSTLSEFLKGKTAKLDITKAQNIANTLGCTLDFLVGNDTIGIDLSTYLKSEREEHGESTGEVSADTKIPEALIMKYESGEERVSAFLFEKLCNHYDMDTWDFLTKYDLYSEFIPPQFNGNVKKYEAFKKAEMEDVMKTQSRYPELKDIIEKGLYVVNGFPARRSFRMTLEPFITEMYKHPWSVWITADTDMAGTIAEYIEVAKHLMTNPDDIKRLDEEFKARKNDDPDELFDWAYKIYSDIVFAKTRIRT